MGKVLMTKEEAGKFAELLSRYGESVYDCDCSNLLFYCDDFSLFFSEIPIITSILVNRELEDKERTAIHINDFINQLSVVSATLSTLLHLSPAIESLSRMARDAGRLLDEED